MFESICFRQQSNPTDKIAIDLGLLAEAMLFYSDVLVIANQDMLRQMITTWGDDLIFRLLEDGHLRIAYQYKMTGISTMNSGTPNELHSGMIFNSPDHALEKIAPKLFEELTGKTGRGRRLATRLMRSVVPYEHRFNILEDFLSDTLDQSFMNDAIRKLLQRWAPDYLASNPQVEFKTRLSMPSIGVDTNIDFVQVNKNYNSTTSPTHTITPSYILANILTMRENLNIASETKADLAVSPLNSDLLATKVSRVFNQHSQNISQIATFQDFVMDDGKTIREIINGGSKSYDDFIDLLEKSKKFKDWIKNKPADANLVKEYFKEVTQSSWVEKLPGKSFRWLLFTGAGLGIDALGAGGIGTATGLALSAADNFLLDGLIKGWKPNHFVEDHLRNFPKV